MDWIGLGTQKTHRKRVMARAAILYINGSAKRWSPGCANAAGKARQKKKVIGEEEQNSPNLGTAFRPIPVCPGREG